MSQPAAQFIPGISPPEPSPAPSKAKPPSPPQPQQATVAAATDISAPSPAAPSPATASPGNDNGAEASLDNMLKAAGEGSAACDKGDESLDKPSASSLEGANAADADALDARGNDQVNVAASTTGPAADVTEQDQMGRLSDEQAADEPAVRSAALPVKPHEDAAAVAADGSGDSESAANKGAPVVLTHTLHTGVSSRCCSLISHALDGRPCPQSLGSSVNYHHRSPWLTNAR